MNWPISLKKKVKLAEPLSLHTTFKIGGPARYFFTPENIHDLRFILKLAKKNKLKIFVIGKGSNLLIPEKGIYGIVINLSQPYFKKIVFKGNYLKVGSGTLLPEVIRRSSLKGLSGFESLSGIPATVGGALMMNAGIPNFNISDLVEQIKVIDYNGKIKVFRRKKLKFSYRRSNLTKLIILEAFFKLAKTSIKDTESAIKRYLQQRRETQDLSWASAGCIFKNPRGDFAGRLIDRCGLKGKNIGGAFISNKHANFIINKGKATSRDVLKLMEMIKEEVKKRFNINLKPEIKIWKN
jgi:UDP-N-acetylmuramate dehydrogenase